MSNPDQPKASGRITRGPLPDDNLVPKTLEFVRTQLPNWRDDFKRPKSESEKSLNSTLCDFLEHRRREILPMARFKHESPQYWSRTVDIGVHGTDDETLIDASTYSLYEPFLVIECKRLPAPGGKDRVQEYVTGTTENGSPTGGIQRFKLGLHGSNVRTAILVGYIQENDPNHWHRTINKWIQDLTKSNPNDSLQWRDNEKLSKPQSESDTSTHCLKSEHPRLAPNSQLPIELHHYWIVMAG